MFRCAMTTLLAENEKVTVQANTHKTEFRKIMTYKQRIQINRNKTNIKQTSLSRSSIMLQLFFWAM